MTGVRQVTEEDLQLLYTTFAQVDDPNMIAAFMEDVCTVREVQEMAQRLHVAHLLEAGESYAVIQEATGASATTIARVSKSLNYGANGYHAVIAAYKVQQKDEV
ncbi:MAG: TrpR-like protein YerC/YecD [Coriobacteriales bacterium]|nr:TrpR-like protein YerC/YecD [Coriobacteriales bacterium]